MFERIARFFGLKNKQSEDFVRRRVLIVDDNVTDLRLIQTAIEKAGHEVLTAENGKSGIEIAQSEKLDLILSDCRMPEMDGVEMCKQLKDNPVTQDIPIVFLTGVETPATVVECFDMGVENYICKPIQPKLLATQIETIFKECLA